MQYSRLSQSDQSPTPLLGRAARLGQSNRVFYWGGGELRWRQCYGVSAAALRPCHQVRELARELTLASRQASSGASGRATTETRPLILGRRQTALYESA